MNEHMSDKNNKGLQLQMCHSIRMSITTSPVRLISCKIFSYAKRDGYSSLFYCSYLGIMFWDAYGTAFAYLKSHIHNCRDNLSRCIFCCSQTINLVLYSSKVHRKVIRHVIRIKYFKIIFLALIKSIQMCSMIT